MILLHALARPAVPMFSRLMRIEPIRRFVEGFYDAHGRQHPWILRGLTPFYMAWYGREHVYSPTSYRSFQERYWDTVGQWRWARSHDYSDMHRTLTTVLRPTDQALLEVGCGTGTMLREIGAWFPELSRTGNDVSGKMCEQARTISRTRIVQGAYGPSCALDGETFDIVIARSTLTLVDESDIDAVLGWLVQTTRRVLIISEPSGIDDPAAIAGGRMVVESVTGQVYKRSHDHTHIRDYAQYPALRAMQLHETRLETAHGRGNRQWIFLR